MGALDSSTQLRQRLVLAMLGLVIIVAGGTVGLWALGREELGAEAWPLGECAYFVITTITTVGFGELPHLSAVPGGHLITVVVLLLGLGVSVYTFSALTTYFVEGEFTKVWQRRRVRRMIDQLKDHIIVCGVGTTGIHVVEELLATGWPVVAVDLDEQHLARAQALAGGQRMPILVGDATEDAVLEAAGIRRARGLVAALTDDKSNLYIVVTARELNRSLRIVAKGVEVKAAEKLRHAGADRVVNPAYIGGVRMVSELIRPQVVEFLDQMLTDREKNLRIEEVEIPAGSPWAGKPLMETQAGQQSNVLVIAIRERGEGRGPGRFVYNPGPETELAAGATLIVLGETANVQALRKAVAAPGTP